MITGPIRTGCTSVSFTTKSGCRYVDIVTLWRHILNVGSTPRTLWTFPVVNFEISFSCLSFAKTRLSSGAVLTSRKTHWAILFGYCTCLLTTQQLHHACYFFRLFGRYRIFVSMMKEFLHQYEHFQNRLQLWLILLKIAFPFSPDLESSSVLLLTENVVCRPGLLILWASMCLREWYCMLWTIKVVLDIK